MGRFIAYLHNSVFPPLLSEAEEASYIARFCQGDKEAHNALIEHNLRLVAHICKKFESTGIDKEDLISIGSIGLIKGINSFCPDKGVRLATYAARCIENEVLMYLRAIRNQKSEISLYEPMGMDKEGNEVVLFDLLGSSGEEIFDGVERAAESELLRQKMDVLDAKEQRIIMMRYGFGINDERCTQREVAQKLGISRSYVSRIEKKALTKLTRAIKEI